MSATATIARAEKALPIVYIALAIAGGFVLWKLIRAAQTGVANAVAPATEALAEIVVDAKMIADDPMGRNLDGSIKIASESNAVVLPSGQRTTWEAILASGSRLKSDNTFTYLGTKYVVIGRGQDGAWQTRLA
jgi:hypothetical protein